MRTRSFSVFALSLAFLAVGLAGPDAAEAGRCKKLRPTNAKVCLRKCNRSTGSFLLKFSEGEPGFVFTVRLDGCVDFEVEIGPNGTAKFALSGLTDLEVGYVKVIVPAEPFPKEYVPGIKCRS